MGSRLWFPTLGLVAWLCCLSPGPALGGKILVFPVDGSHWLSLKILVKELATRGHDVLVLVPESSLLMHEKENYGTEFYPVPYNKDEMDGAFRQLSDGLYLKPPQFTDLFVNIERFVNFTTFQNTGCESLLNNKAVMNRLRETGFDLVLTDPFLPCGSMVAHFFSIPAVYFLRGLPCWLDLKANQCPSPPSFVPASFSENTPTMTFLQRVKNVVMTAADSYICHLLFGHYDVLVKKYLGDDMTYQDLIGRGAIWLLRYEFAFEWPRPVLPNMVLIGGINCAKKAPLPADLEEYVNDSRDDGFIVFTLGSMVSKMPVEKATVFLNAFRQIPQRVLWRYTGTPLKDVPKNVKLMKWLPQNDLLAHPKAKLFITHGGTHGVYEGICNGVPMLMFPLFGDQGDNVLRMVTRGVAERLSIHDVTTETLLAALIKMTSDKSYKEKMATLSEIHLDRPVPPVELAVFWTEFVIRNKGASHLRVAAHNLNWFQYHSLDVIGFLVIIVLTVLWLTLKCCLFCTRRCCRKAGAKTKSD